MHSRNPQPWWPVPWTPAQKEPSNCGSPGAQPSPANQKKRPRQHQLKSCKTPKQQSPQIPVAMKPSLRLTEEAVLILTIPQITQLPNHPITKSRQTQPQNPDRPGLGPPSK